MSNSKKVCLVLTPEGREVLKDDVISNMLKDGKYFLCSSMKQNGYFMDIKVSFNEKSHIYDLSIPLRWVLYVVSLDLIKKIGFKTD